MLDIGWSELVVIGVVALIVVGPKDLPVMFRTLGQLTGKARGMAREFTSAMNAAADETGMRDIGRDLDRIGKLANPRKAGLDAIQKSAEAFEKWDPETQPEPDAPATIKPGTATSRAAAEARLATDEPAAAATPDPDKQA